MQEVMGRIASGAACTTVWANSAKVRQFGLKQALRPSASSESRTAAAARLVGESHKALPNPAEINRARYSARRSCVLPLLAGPVTTRTRAVIAKNLLRPGRAPNRVTGLGRTLALALDR